MKHEIIPAGGGPSYDWGSDHICVKTTCNHAEGRVTVVEDELRPGFCLRWHLHKKMTEIFYILVGEVTFKFREEVVVATPGMTINIPPGTPHEVESVTGARLITIFSPGGFDQYLAKMATLNDAQFADEELMRSLSEEYDTWML